MRTIALMTIFQVPNYGSVLQAYATQVVIESFGYKCEIVNYDYPNEWQYSHGMRSPTIKAHLGRFVYSYLWNGKLRFLKRFKQKHLHLSPFFKNFESLEIADWKKYDFVVLGSDQVWKTQYNRSDPAFLLSFLPDDVARFSIASSFGMNYLPEKDKHLFIESLQQFKAISVREKSGLRILEDLKIDVPYRMLLDPVLLLSQNQWTALYSPYLHLKRKKYILLYLLSYAFEPRPYIYQLVEKLKKELGYEVITLAGYQSPSKVFGLKMINRSEASIEEFIQLFAHSEIVVTSSFHGTAFALIYGKPLISVVPQNEDDRQSSLLRQLNVSQCIVPIGTPFNKINPYYNVHLEQEALESVRRENLLWIKQQLNS